MILIIPAIDIKGGKCVQMVQGVPGYVYSDDPIEMAKLWRKENAKSLHVTDVDGAMEGRLVNFEIIRKMVAAVNIPIELGGGLRTFEEVDRAIDAGLYRVVIETMFLENPDEAKRVLEKFGPSKIVAGISAAEWNRQNEGMERIFGYDRGVGSIKCRCTRVQTDSLYRYRCGWNTQWSKFLDDETARRGNAPSDHRFRRDLRPSGSSETAGNGITRSRFRHRRQSSLRKSLFLSGDLAALRGGRVSLHGETLMIIAVIGHLCMDVIQHADGTETQSYGGIYFSVATLANLLTDEDTIRPVFGIGKNEYDEFVEHLGRYPNVDCSGIFKFPGSTNQVRLVYSSNEERIECSRFISEPIPWKRIRPSVAHADLVLVNMISGMDITLETLDELRMEVREDHIPVYLDVHSITLGIKPDFTRFHRPVEQWRRWLFMLHGAHLNEEEPASSRPSGSLNKRLPSIFSR